MQTQSNGSEFQSPPAMVVGQQQQISAAHMQSQGPSHNGGASNGPVRFHQHNQNGAPTALYGNQPSGASNYGYQQPPSAPPLQPSYAEWMEIDGRMQLVIIKPPQHVPRGPSTQVMQQRPPAQESPVPVTTSATDSVFDSVDFDNKLLQSIATNPQVREAILEIVKGPLRCDAEEEDDEGPHQMVSVVKIRRIDDDIFDWKITRKERDDLKSKKRFMSSMIKCILKLLHEPQRLKYMLLTGVSRKGRQVEKLPELSMDIIIGEHIFQTFPTTDVILISSSVLQATLMKYHWPLRKDLPKDRLRKSASKGRFIKEIRVTLTKQSESFNKNYTDDGERITKHDTDEDAEDSNDGTAKDGKFNKLAVAGLYKAKVKPIGAIPDQHHMPKDRPKKAPLVSVSSAVPSTPSAPLISAGQDEGRDDERPGPAPKPPIQNVTAGEASHSPQAPQGPNNPPELQPSSIQPPPEPSNAKPPPQPPKIDSPLAATSNDAPQKPSNNEVPEPPASIPAQEPTSMNESPVPVSTNQPLQPPAIIHPPPPPQQGTTDPRTPRSTTRGRPRVLRNFSIAEMQHCFEAAVH